MTKMIKTWQKFSFWNKIRLTLGAIGIGGEITLYIQDSYPEWKIVAGCATLGGILITYIFKDDNQNNVADIFESNKNKSGKP